MPTPAITASTRYFDVAITRVYYLPVIAASTLVPTRTEMNNGINLTPELNDLSGWVVDAEFFDTQNINTPFRTKAPGVLSTPDSTLTFYTSKTGVDVRASLPPGTTGYIMFLDGGDVAANRAEVYPVTVAAVNVLRSSGNTIGGTGTNGPARVTIKFAITAAPNQNVTVPA